MAELLPPAKSASAIYVISILSRKSVLSKIYYIRLLVMPTIRFGQCFEGYKQKMYIGLIFWHTRYMVIFYFI